MRAALSERDVCAKTHRGAWHEFRNKFVETGAIGRDLAAAAQKVQPDREQVDYDAWQPPADEARRAIELAGVFVEAVQRILR